jgi:hypothetical protein
VVGHESLIGRDLEESGCAPVRVLPWHLLGGTKEMHEQLVRITITLTCLVTPLKFI